MQAKKAILSGNAMIWLSLISQRVIRPLLHLGLYLTGGIEYVVHISWV